MGEATLEPIAGGYVLHAVLADGRATMLLPTEDGAEIAADGLTAQGGVAVRRADKHGAAIEIATQ